MSTMYVNNIAPLEGTTINVASGNTLNAPGHVIQVVQTVLRTTSVHTLNNLGSVGYAGHDGYNLAGADITDLDAAITPISASSKVLVNISINFAMTGNNYGVFRLKRGINGATPTVSGNDLWSAPNQATSQQSGSVPIYSSETYTPAWLTQQVNFQYLDSPNTTSEIVYRPNFSVEKDASGTNLHINQSVYATNDYGRRKGVSTVTLMEIAQ